MTILEIIGVVANIVSIAAIIFTTRGRKTFKSFYANPYFKVFGISLCYTVIVFAVPWNKIHLSFGDSEPRTKDTVIITQSSPKTEIQPDVSGNMPVRPRAQKTNPQLTNGKGEVAPAKPPVKSDTSNRSKYDLRQSQFNAPTQIGDGNVQVNGKIQEHLQQQDLLNILRYLPQKSRKITLMYQTPDFESKEYCMELKRALSANGYTDVILFGHLTVGFDPPPYKITVDTVSYTINVELN